MREQKTPTFPYFVPDFGYRPSSYLPLQFQNSWQWHSNWQPIKRLIFPVLHCPLTIPVYQSNSSWVEFLLRFSANSKLSKLFPIVVWQAATMLSRSAASSSMLSSIIMLKQPGEHSDLKVAFGRSWNTILEIFVLEYGILVCNTRIKPSIYRLSWLELRDNRGSKSIHYLKKKSSSSILQGSIRHWKDIFLALSNWGFPSNSQALRI